MMIMIMFEGGGVERKTDPKTRKHTLCEPAPSKFIRTFHKNYCLWKLTEKTRRPILRHPFRASFRSRNARADFIRTICVEIELRNAKRSSATVASSELAESECIWTCHEGCSAWKFKR